MKRSGLRRKGRKRVPSLDAFAAAVLDGAVCVICGAPATDPHHYVPKANLKGLPAAYVDPRNGVPLDALCHAQITNGRLACPRPPELDAFLEEHQLLESGRPVPARYGEAA